MRLSLGRARVFGALVIDACAVLAAGIAGCGVDPPADTGSSAASSAPSPAAFADVGALFDAVDESGAPRVGGFIEDPDPDDYFAGGTKAVFLVEGPMGTLALDDGAPADNVVAAVYRSEAALSKGLGFGPRMASQLGWPSVWQLKGPDWAVWAIRRQTLQSLRGALGGALSEVRAD